MEPNVTAEYYNPQQSVGSSDYQEQTPQTQSTTYQPPLPPRRTHQNFGDDDPSNPIHYTRDPHKLIAYLIPFPKPRIQASPSSPPVPQRFLIYTPPPPPLSKPAEGEKEERL